MQPVRSIVIVGGGSSGWMAAAYLSKVLRGVQVTLIESPANPIIGVGEATIPFIRNFMHRIGLVDDRVWMSECDATFKSGILFENWYERGDRYWHPLFENLDYLDRHIHVGHGWLARRAAGDPRFHARASFYQQFFATTEVNSVENRVPATNEYAYHFDVHRYIELLRHTATGVRHLTGTVSEVKLDERGAIAALMTVEHGELVADLFVDCSGFKRALIGKVDPAGKFESYASSLFCDRAVVIRFPYVDDAEKRVQMHPYVKASAQSAGWIWTIPLFSKISTGYVYSSRFLADDDAVMELRRHWGEDRTRDLPALSLKFAVGKLQRLWVQNCVAVGLSGGFIEPLESTGLAITQLGVEMLASMLDTHHFDTTMAVRYNGYLEKFYRDVLQFIIAHYHGSRREDTAFWRAVRHETVVPDDLRARLEVFQRYLPTSSTKGTSEVWMFRDLSWFSVLLGMNFPFEAEPLDEASLTSLERVWKHKQDARANLLARLPNHYEYLRDKVYPS